MARKYKKRTARSRRKESFRGRNGKVLGMDPEQGSVNLQLMLPLQEVAQDLSTAVEGLATEAGLLIIQALLGQEVEAKAGPKHSHGQIQRWGEEDSYVIYGGKKIPFPRQRLRTRDGQELGLDRLAQFQQNGLLQRKVANRVLRGVSTRDYEGSLDAVCDGYGIRKSSVSRHWKMISAKRLQELMERPLHDLDLVAIMIDGLDYQDNLLVVALGFTSDGRKHILGMWPGATEHHEVVGALFEDLVRRGVRTDRKYLFVLDGSKALRKAVRRHFGADQDIQRCQVHKERNVLKNLPEKYKGMVSLKLRAAWKMQAHDKAEEALKGVLAYLQELNPDAAASLQEGFDDTLTVHRLKMPAKLRITFKSTNPIESCFEINRKHCRNAKNWKNRDMVLRWAGTVFLEAEKKFRRIHGYKEIPVLLNALRGKDVELKRKAG